MFMSSYITVDGWLTMLWFSQKLLASLSRLSDQNQNQTKILVLVRG